VPLATHIGRITSSFEHLSNRHTSEIQIATIPIVFRIKRHVPHTGLVRVKTRKKRSTRWTASSGIVKLFETKTIGSKPI
jgi:hypothetical protein